MADFVETGKGTLTAVHAWSEKNPKTSYALVWAGTTFAWYAMPDFCRSKTVRFLGKSVLTAGLALHELHLTAADEQTTRFEEATEKAISDWSKERLMATGVAVTLIAVGATVAFEKALFRRGERKRAAGKRFTHAKQALVLAGLAGLGGKLVAENMYPDA